MYRAVSFRIYNNKTNAKKINNNNTRMTNADTGTIKSVSMDDWKTIAPCDNYI